MCLIELYLTAARLTYGTEPCARLSDILRAISSGGRIATSHADDAPAFAGVTAFGGEAARISEGVPMKRRSQSPPRPQRDTHTLDTAANNVKDAAIAVALVAVCGMSNKSGDRFGLALARYGPRGIASQRDTNFLNAFFDVLLTWGVIDGACLLLGVVCECSGEGSRADASVELCACRPAPSTW